METVYLRTITTHPPPFPINVFVRNLYFPVAIIVATTAKMYDPLAYLVVIYLLLYRSYTNVDTRPWIETMRCDMKKK